MNARLDLNLWVTNVNSVLMSNGHSKVEFVHRVINMLVLIIHNVLPNVQMPNLNNMD